MRPEHAPISPSAFKRIMGCPASVSLQKPYPNKSGEAAKIGTAVHYAGEMDLKGTLVSAGDKAPNGVVIDQDMLNRVKLYTDFCKNITYTERWIEETVDCKRIHESECWGTPDFAAYDSVRNHLTVVDYKDGHTDVDPFENPQGIIYTSGIIDLLPAGIENTIVVEMVIIQPNSGGIKIWKTTAVALRNYINRYRNAAYKALEPNPVAVAGTHCKWCLAMNDCNENKLEVTKVFKDVQSITNPTAEDLDRLYYAKQMIGDKLMVAEALAMVKPPAGYEVGTGRGSVKWTADMKTVQDMAMLYGLDVMKEPALITPIQARNLGLVIDSLSEFTSGKPKLKRINMKKLADMFSKDK